MIQFAIRCRSLVYPITYEDIILNSHKLFRFSSMSIFVIKGMILLDLGTAVQWPMIARAVNNYLPWDDSNVLQPLDVFQAH